MLHCPQCGRTYAGGEAACPLDGSPLRADSTVAAYVPLDPLVGQVLDDKYRLDERLGEGGMGTVYRAAHLLIDRPVAVKVLHQRFVEDEAAQQRFRREARAAGRLRHPNAVAVTDFGQTADGRAYIVMELLEGRTLREVLTADAPLPFARAVALACQAAAAVEAAHESGVIHRDLKPGNIFVAERRDSPPLVKVLDFGIAKLAADSSDDSDSRNLTQTGVMIGTPRYMSPEQCDGEGLTPASDVYSLGILLYEMLTGVAPFNGPTPLAVALQHSAKPPRPPRELVPAIPAELERVVLHALAKRPGERPADAGEFRRELGATARLLGIENASAASPHDASGSALDTSAFDTSALDALAAPHDGRVAADDRVASADGRAFASRDDAAASANGDGKEPSARVVIDLEELRERRRAQSSVAGRASGEADAGGVPNETTLLADTSERARLAARGANARPEAPTASAGRGAAVFARPRAFTRIQVLLKKRRPALFYWLSQPPVLIATVLALLVLGVAVAGVVKSRRAGGQAAAAPAENSEAAAAPTPTPEASPSPSPTAEQEDNRNAGRRAARSRRPARRQPQGNPVKRALKKVFRNPF
jgi:eukaryotic-like serine/threonine-protein kinase